MTTITTTTTTTLIPFPLNCGKGRDDRLIVANETRFRSFGGETARRRAAGLASDVSKAHERSVSETQSIRLSFCFLPSPSFSIVHACSRVLLELNAAPCPSRSRSKRHGGKRERRKRDDMPRFGHATPIDTVEPLFLA